MDNTNRVFDILRAHASFDLQKTVLVSPGLWHPAGTQERTGVKAQY